MLGAIIGDIAGAAGDIPHEYAEAATAMLTLPLRKILEEFEDCLRSLPGRG